jgi:hypothetical protein
MQLGGVNYTDTFYVGDTLVTVSRCYEGEFLSNLWTLECRHYHNLPALEKGCNAAWEPMLHAAQAYYQHRRCCTMCCTMTRPR